MYLVLRIHTGGTGCSGPPDPGEGTEAEFVDNTASSLYYEFVKMEAPTSSQARNIHVAVSKVVDAAKLSLYAAHKCEDEILSLIAAYNLQHFQARLPLSVSNVFSEERVTHISIPCQLAALLELQRGPQEV